jgi:DNA modification methylase
MRPYYQESDLTLYCGDAREIIPTLPMADLVLTDPPYGHGVKWKGGTWANDPMYSVDALRWDAEPVASDLLELAVAHGKYAIVWGGNYFALPPSRCWLAWDKFEKMDTLADFELAWTNFDRPSKSYTERRNPNGKRYHATQKPVGLFAWCASFMPGLILDPFAGSGTSLVAAKMLGRPAIACEISETFCEIICNRLRQEILPLCSPDPQPEQMNLI